MFAQLKLYALIAAAIAVIALAAYAKWTHDRLVHWKGRAEVVEAKLTLERKARATEQADRRKADDAAKSLEAELERIRNVPPAPSVLCRPRRAGVPGEGGATASAADTAIRSGAEEPLQDIGAALADVWREHQSNAARHRGLIEWERQRSH